MSCRSCVWPEPAARFHTIFQDVLGKIWKLADQDKDNKLRKNEFIIAMYRMRNLYFMTVVLSILKLRIWVW